jgi:Family of unknown function (DUF5995)
MTVLRVPSVGRAAGIDEVVARMESIVEALPPHDGVAAFTRLYLAVTQAVRAGAKGNSFEDPADVRWLDVMFANLYFDAVDASSGGGHVPRAWAPLFEARTHKGILPLQFALAGMNAHINRDLPVALVETCAQGHIELKDGSAQHRDFLKVNGLLARTEEQAKRGLLEGFDAVLDVALGNLDDVLAMWDVERARDAAWVNAQTLWALRGAASLRNAFLDSLDRMVGFAGRGLLRPLPTAVDG